MNLTVNATCISETSKTGIERFAINIAKELYNIDNSVNIINSEPISGLPTAQISHFLNISKKVLGKNEYFARAVWDQTLFRSQISKHNANVVFFPIQDGLFNSPVKQVITVHDLHYAHFDRSIPECRSEIGSFRTKFYRLKLPLLLKESSAVITVSKSTKNELINTFGLPPDKVHVVYNGYDEARFKVIEGPGEYLASLGLEADSYILYVGSILRHKNLLRLVQAFARLRGDIKLVIVGLAKDQGYLEKILETAAILGIPDGRLRYLEYVSDRDLPYLYNGAIAFALPSLHEGFGVPLIEAMACGAPVVTSNCSAMPEVAGGAALLVDPYSVEAIADALQGVIDNPLQAEFLRMAGFEQVKMFNWSLSAKRVYDICKSVYES